MGHRLLERIGLAKPRWLLLPALALALALPPPATAYLYWVNNGNIARSNLDGTAVREDYIPISYSKQEHKGIATITLGGPYIYLTGGEVGHIGRVNLDGSGFVPTLFTMPQPAWEAGDEPLGASGPITITGEHIYWSSPNFVIKEHNIKIVGDTIGRANIDGGDIEPNLILTNDYAWIAADSEHIYWVAQGSHRIERANLDGHEIEPHFIVSPSEIHGLAVSEGYVYWSAEHGVGRANSNGHGVDEHFITGLPYYPFNITVGGGYIFWEAWEYPQGSVPLPLHVIPKPPWVGRADIDGSAIRQRIVTFPGFDSGSISANSLGPGAGPPAHPPRHHPQRPRRHRHTARPPRPHRRHGKHGRH